jgi:hypothetical protein
VIDIINFGAGWFSTLGDGEAEAVTDRLSALARGRAAGPWWGAELMWRMSTISVPLLA